MRIDATDEQSKLYFFKDLYEHALSYAETSHENFAKYYAQYKGSNEIDGSDTAASVVRNITYELLESQVSSYIPNPTVRPKSWNDRNGENAQVLETLLRNLRDELPFEVNNDRDERFNPVYGGSVWLVEWDESIESIDGIGGIKLSCLAPHKFIGQPKIYNVEDMEYCFVRFETTKEDIVRKYGVSYDIADETESDEGNDDDSTATLIVCYYKDDDDKVCEFIWSADTVLLDISDYYSRKRQICKKCGERKGVCLCDDPKFELITEEFETLTRDIPLSDGTFIPAMSPVVRDGQVVMEKEKRSMLDESGNVVLDEFGLPMLTDVEVPKLEPTKIPFYRPSLFPVVIRRNISEEDSLWGQSDCEAIRPQQQGVNKVESRIMEKLMGSGVFPMVPENCKIDLDNSLFKRVFRVRQDTANLFGRLDLQVDISRDIEEAERLYNHAKRILGISDSYQGQYDPSAQSGKAKQVQVAQSAGRLDSKRRMKNAAYADIDKIIFMFYLAYADEPRSAAYVDSYGFSQNRSFNRYEFLVARDNGKYEYDDGFLFSADASADIERQREFLWQENRENFRQGTYGDPALPQTQLIYWLNMEKAHYPFAHDNVERLRQLIKEMQMAATKNNGGAKP